MPYFNVYEAFNSLDMDGSGAISREEFKRLIQSRGYYVSEKEATEIVEKMDKNKNGRVSFAEVSQTSGLESERAIRTMIKHFNQLSLSEYSLLITFVTTFLTQCALNSPSSACKCLTRLSVLVPRGDHAKKPSETLKRHNQIAPVTDSRWRRRGLQVRPKSRSCWSKAHTFLQTSFRCAMFQRLPPSMVKASSLARLAVRLL